MKLSEEQQQAIHPGKTTAWIINVRYADDRESDTQELLAYADLPEWLQKLIDPCDTYFSLTLVQDMKTTNICHLHRSLLEV